VGKVKLSSALKKPSPAMAADTIAMIRYAYRLSIYSYRTRLHAKRTASSFLRSCVRVLVDPGVGQAGGPPSFRCPGDPLLSIKTFYP